MTDRTATNAARPEWADDEIRLDPFEKKQDVHFRRGGSEASHRLSREGAVFRQRLSCGVPLTMALPMRAFEGVAARAFDDADGTTRVTLELLHADPALSVPLHASSAVDDAANDWHCWAKTTRLPMIVIDHAGHCQVVKAAQTIASNGPRPRRHRASNLKRRPLFLRRRKTGMIGPTIRLDAEEIIARN